ncbi:hypothetical protein K1719_046933 [Acacia pycnantha]|nr:hypothetical protein K1719_046933 [Acacia pycnantha]
MINPKLKWTIEANVGEILPENVGYNIGDCDFIFGPTLFINHWFCYVLDTRTMVFYALDSLVEHRTYYRMQHEKENPTLKTTKKKKKTELEKSKDLMANKVRNNLLAILRTLKPELLQDDHKIPKDVTWPKVHVQTDTHSCGVHVLTWLQMWDGS